MDEALAHWLTGEDGRRALAEAAGLADPASVAAAQALRRRWSPEQAAAVSHQEQLRRRGVAKFGERARSLWWTADGLEQATRAPVAAWRAARLAAAGATRVVDLGCGVGADALAFADAGLEVVAVERDPVTAVLARANLAGRGEVLVGDAVELAGTLVGPGDAVFVDPARRTARGRTWRISEVSPPWDWATGLVSGRLGCVKAGPGLSTGDLPASLAAVWVSDRGDLVETGLWSGDGRPPGSRTALLLPGPVELAVDPGRRPAVGDVAGYLYEPDPAVIRAGGLARVADLVGGWALAERIAYLASDRLVPTPLATAFAVRRELAFDERAIRAWLREEGVGVLEIKVRGIDVDPAVLRRRLKPSGSASATLVITPTRRGARALVADRVS